KTLGATGYLTERFTESSRRLRGLEVRSELAGRWMMSAMTIVVGIIPALLYLAAGTPFGGAHISIGTLVAFVALQTGWSGSSMGTGRSRNSNRRENRAIELTSRSPSTPPPATARWT